MKTITSRVEEVRQQISDGETKLAGLNKELTQHSEELEAVKNEADAQEREEGMCMQCTLHCTSVDAYTLYIVPDFYQLVDSHFSV